MKDDLQNPGLASRWALPVSLAVHLSIAALVIFGLPVSLFQPEEEQAVDVELVQPPEQQEEAKAEPPPQEKAEEPEPEKPEEPEQAAEEKPPPAGDEADGQQAAPEVISPVFQFGEKDAGPRQALDGNSPEEGSASPEAEREAEKPQPAQPPALTADGSENQLPPPGEPEAAAPNPAEAAKAEEGAEPKEAERLYSQQATGDVIATSAMGRLPRGVRGGRLCVTELREQLRNTWPPYFPDLLPSFRLDDGMEVIDAQKAAFRVGGEWYDLSYRCEVDTDATKVVGFAFRVGDLLPPAERERRRLPSR